WPVADRKHGPKGTENAASGAPGGASSRSQGGRRRLRKVSRAASPAAQGVSQTPASAGAPLPSRSEELHFGLRRTRRRSKNTGDHPCPHKPIPSSLEVRYARSSGRRHATFLPHSLLE